MSAAAFFIVDDKWFPLSVVQAMQARRISDKELKIHIFVESRRLQTIDFNQSGAAAAAAGIVVHKNALSPLIPQGLPATAAWPSLVYGRLFAHHILNYDRLLYLDADVIIDQPLDKLLTLDLNNKSVAASHCAESLADPNRSASYFNAGVMLIAREKWLRHDMFHLCIDFFQRNGAKAKFQDQDFLNELFRGDWRVLSPRWNCQPPYMDCGLLGGLQPAIYHFWGRWKPWHPTAPEPLEGLVRMYRREARAAGIDPDALAAALPPTPTGMRQKLSEALAKRLFQAGIYTPRMRRRLARLRQKRELYSDFISRTEFADPIVFDEKACGSNVHFDGRRFSLG